MVGKQFYFLSYLFGVFRTSIYIGVPCHVSLFPLLVRIKNFAVTYRVGGATSLLIDLAEEWRELLEENRSSGLALELQENEKNYAANNS